jgi:hypothetical protein
MPRSVTYRSFAASPPPPRSPRVTAAAAPLTPGRRRLLELMHRLHYGKVEGLPVVAGDPRLDDPGVRVVGEHKFAASEAAPPPSPLPADYASRDQVVALLRLLNEKPDGVILALDVKHSLPFRALVADSPAPSPAN